MNSLHITGKQGKQKQAFDRIVSAAAHLAGSGRLKHGRHSDLYGPCQLLQMLTHLQKYLSSQYVEPIRNCAV